MISTVTTECNCRYHCLTIAVVGRSPEPARVTTGDLHRARLRGEIRRIAEECCDCPVEGS